MSLDVLPFGLLTFLFGTFLKKSSELSIRIVLILPCPASVVLQMFVPVLKSKYGHKIWLELMKSYFIILSQCAVLS